MRLGIKRAGVYGGVLFVAIQFVPYGHDHTNPPVTQEPPWNSPETRELAHRSCYDCHSNETTWPWYSNVAPASWLTQSDVDGARHWLNFTEWNRPQRGAGKAAEEVRSGDMPPWDYLLMHPNARLTTTEREALAAGLAATIGSGQKTQIP